MDEVITIGLDITKQVFHVHGADGSGRALFSRRIGAWLGQMMARKPRMLVTVAQANKIARIV